MTEPSTTTTTAIASTPEGTMPPGATVTEPRSLRVRILSSMGFAAIAIVGVLIVLYAWQLPPFSSAVETTENALVRGQVTIIGPQLSGYVFEVPVQDFQYVKAGDLLVRLDDRIYKQRLDQALAQLAVQKASLANVVQQRNSAEATIKLRQAALVDSQAQARKSTADLRRNEELISDGSVSKRELDVTRAANAQTVAAVAQAQASLEIARQDLQTVIVNRGSLEAAVASADAAVELARIDLSNTRITAPRDGQLGQIGVRLGAYVNFWRAADGTGAEAAVGDCQYERNPNGQCAGRPAGDLYRGCAEPPQVSWHGAAYFAGHRLGVQPVAGGQRDGQLCEDCPARAGKDYGGPGSG